MKVAVSCEVPALEKALVAALLERDHTVVLVGNEEAKRAVAKRWPTVTSAGAASSAITFAEADCVIVVDERVALRPSREADATSRQTASLPASSGARRLVLVTPEEVTPPADVPWLEVRADAVFGAAAPEDDLVSALLALVRTVPIAPVFPGAHVRMEPVFAPDLAKLVVRWLEKDDAWNRAHDVRGPESVTLDELLTRLAALAEKTPTRIPLPSLLTGASAAFLNLFGVKNTLPDAATMERLAKRAPVTGAATAARADFTPLDEALKELASSLPEQLPISGYGDLSHKRFWVDIEGSPHRAEALQEIFRRSCSEILPIAFDVEESLGSNEVTVGRTLTASLPLRGHIQMRVEEVLPRRVTLATVEGHPIAGIVRFMTEPNGTAIRFTVEVFARSSTPFDFVALKAGGSVAQNLTWKHVCERMLDASDGTSEHGVEHAFESLTEDGAHRVMEWIEQLVAKREREAHEAELPQRPSC